MTMQEVEVVRVPVHSTERRQDIDLRLAVIRVLAEYRTQIERQAFKKGVRFAIAFLGSTQEGT